MKFSSGLSRVFEDAQLIAQRYDCPYLESWHILLSFVVNHDTVAGSALMEFPADIDDFEQAKFDSLSEGLKKTIQESAEWRGTYGEQPKVDEINSQLAKASLSDIDDDMPF